MMTTMPAIPFRLIPFLSLLAIAPAMAQQGEAPLASCAGIGDAAQRLACYDRLAGVAPAAGTATAMTPPPASGRAIAAASPSAAAATVGSATIGTTPAPGSPAAKTDPDVEAAMDLSPDRLRGFSLADHWELDQANKRGIFNFRPHHANYLMVTRTAHPNNEPYRPFRDLTDLATDLSHSELVFQLSFKTKLVESAFGKPLDVWFGYTQNSFWQAGNRKASSPFRETNYQPELMAVTPLDFNVLGMRARFLNLGVVHQSNGQSSTLSRSWNRVYAQVGLERGSWTVVGRVWKRVKEAADDDNNPDIINYMGRGDLNVTYRNNGNDYSALIRRNFSTERGAVQLGWAFPLAGHFKGYVQYFSGYGQSMIDYNYYQNSLGLGVQGTF
jgi:phospholipase A1